MDTTTKTTPLDHGYVMQRDQTETERLDKQNYMLIDMIGYHIHPSIEQNLEPNACIADVATGTGIWLMDLAQQYPSTVQLYGFDVSKDQYPDSGLLPANISLHQHNVKDKFSAEYHGKFDLVQLRFVAGGLKDGDWGHVTNNILEILKPGGAIQWIEPDYSVGLTTRHVDGTEAVAHDTLWNKMASLSGLGAQTEMGAKILPQLFSNAGMTDIISTVALPRTPQRQDEWSRNIIYAPFGILVGLSNRGVAGSDSIEELTKLRDDVLEEFQRGARFSMPVYTTVGFKPK